MTEEIFERYAGEYDAWYDVHRSVYHAELARIQSVLPPVDARSVEVGVGSGRFAGPLGIRLGIEPSRALGGMAYRRGIDVIRGRAESLPLRDNSCSLALLVTVLCFLDDPHGALAELYRIVVPGGALVIGFLERDGPVVRTYLREGEKGRFLSHARFFSSDEVRGLLRQAGFSVLSGDSRQGFGVFVAKKD
ncbi:MAG: methyltransferase type 11 [Methanoculleus sp. SDB]|nr:MAG: methyltransferase type 11 [Methanoculleus sp. SDB]